MQVKRLKNTWIALKQNYTESAHLFDGKLVRELKAMDEGGGSLPLQNISLPHVLPLVLLLERDLGDIKSSLSWEEGSSDFGLDILLAHLDTARVITQQCGLYRVTGENALQDFRPDKSVLDMFRTELHLKLLWGVKGAGVNRMDRYGKFSQVLAVLSQKVEPLSPTNPETAL